MPCRLDQAVITPAMKKCCILILAVVTPLLWAQARDEGNSTTKAGSATLETGQRVTPNRTVPNVKPPKTGLEFSANPTTQEISRARVFEVPLAPIGGEPDAAENAALAT